MNTSPSIDDVLIIGAGPSGLACAIEAKKAGLSHRILDQGAVADAIRRFPTNLTFFSTPELLEIGNIPFLASGFRPTRIEVVRYYQRVAYECGLNVEYHTHVQGLQKEGELFRITTSDVSYRSRNVVFATGYFDMPNPFDVPGSNLPHVHRYYDEPFKYHGQRVVVVGGKNSAVEIALDLFRNGAAVTLIHRGARLSEGIKYWVLPDIENRLKSDDIRGLFESYVKEIKPGTILVGGKHNEEISSESIFVMIGYRPDTRLLEQTGVSLDPVSLAPAHNGETMETTVKGIFVAGSIAAGKLNNTIFIENGRLHGARIIREITKK